MDRKGAWRDNVSVARLRKTIKYEEVYLHAYDTVADSKDRLARYIRLLQSAPAASRA
jgi:putative transposase